MCSDVCDRDEANSESRLRASLSRSVRELKSIGTTAPIFSLPGKRSLTYGYKFRDAQIGKMLVCARVCVYVCIQSLDTRALAFVIVQLIRYGFKGDRVSRLVKGHTAIEPLERVTVLEEPIAVPSVPRARPTSVCALALISKHSKVLTL